MKSIFDWLKKIFAAVVRFVLRYPLAAAGTVFVIAAAVAAAAVGQKFQIGGILGWLWGKKPNVDPSIRVVPPAGRVDDAGNVIQPGQSDDKGYVQVPVQVPIKDPGIFSDPNTVVVEHPTQGEITIPLPTGVKNTDVKQVVQIEPNVYEIHNNDKPSVNAKDLLDELGGKS